MPAQTPPVCQFGWKAADFSLPGVNGRTYALADVVGENGLLVMFICNHCPYVKGAIERIVEDCRALAEHGIGSVAIMPNDTERYPEDNFDKMKLFAARHDLPFPYLIDGTQAVARAYGAACTPDFFGFNRDWALQYRGRLDAAGIHPQPGTRRELREAMMQIVRTGRGPEDQIASIGCSIKWRDAA